MAYTTDASMQPNPSDPTEGRPQPGDVILRRASNGYVVLIHNGAGSVMEVRVVEGELADVAKHLQAREDSLKVMAASARTPVGQAYVGQPHIVGRDGTLLAVLPPGTRDISVQCHNPTNMLVTAFHITTP